MNFYCTAIFGLFCLNAPIGDTTIKIENIGIGMAAEIVAPNWQASFGFTDVPMTLNSSKLDSACIANVCVHYHRHCDDADHPKTCDYAFDAGAGIGGSISVKADNETAFKAALGYLGFIHDDHGVQSKFPFTAFDKEAKFPDPPYCNYQTENGHWVAEEGCPKR
jgi:hypothetical protein